MYFVLAFFFLLTEVGVDLDTGAIVPKHAAVVFNPTQERAQNLSRQMAAGIVLVGTRR